jgi:hypothetical protein
MDTEFVRIGGTFAHTLLWNSAQFTAGGGLAIALRAVRWEKLPDSWRGFNGTVVLITLSALCGSMLPFGTYGVLPLVVTLAFADFAVPACAALLCSNRFFNMLVPFADPSFIWRTGYGRVVLAIAAGTAAGLLLLAFGNRSAGILKIRTAQSETGARLGVKAVVGLVSGLAWKAALFLAAGAILDVLFQRYVIGEVVSFLFANAVTGPLASSFAQRNVVNPLFLLGMWSVAVLTDFVGFSGLAVIVKPKGLVFYAGFCAALAAVLCSSALFA